MTAQLGSKRFVGRAAVVADAFLIGVAVSSVLLWGYLAGRPGWGANPRFSTPLAAVIFFSLPVLAAVLLYFWRRLDRILRVNLAVTLLATIASVYAMEVAAAWRLASLSAAAKPAMVVVGESTNPAREAARVKKIWNVDIDLRSASAVITDLKKRNIDAVPIIAPGNQVFITQPDGAVSSSIGIAGREVMPLGGVANRETVLCNESGQWVHYRSDRHGFNNPDSAWERQSVDVAAVGDSFAHGYCVSPDKSFMARIRKRYPATLNLGMAGDGPLLMLATLREYVAPARPNVVLWFYFEGNDLTDLQVERHSAVLVKYLTDDTFTQGSALGDQDALDDALMKQMPRLKRLEQERRVARERDRAVGRFLRLAKFTSLRETLGLRGAETAADLLRLSDLQTSNMEAFTAILRTTQRQVRQWGGELMFVYLPEWARYTNYTSWGKSQRERVLTAVNNLGVPLIDLDPMFRTMDDPLSLFPFRAQGHYNDRGHLLVADAVLARLSGQLSPNERGPQ